MNETDRKVYTPPTVSVIVPTTCSSTRELCINRAIESILTQTGINLDVLVIANGSHIDEKIIRSFEKNSRLQVIRLELGNVSAARYAGVKRAKGEYFCFLDDDDEFLPGSLKKRIELFQANRLADIVVTNGFKQTNGKDALSVTTDFSQDIMDNPGRSFLKNNWFASAAPLFRSNSIHPEFFNFSLKYFEWTYLFFLLLSEKKKIHYGDEPTYRMYTNSPQSASNSVEYSMAYPEFLLELLSLPLESEFLQSIHGKYLSALNGLSNFELKRGNIWAAWRAHSKCLISGGWKYLPFTRKLFLPWNNKQSI